MHVEPRCFACRATRTGNEALKTSTPVLHTLRGRLKMRTSSWVCRSGKDVPYDGANDGLFAVSIATVYTRTMLDSVLSLCVVGRTTMSSAAAFLAGYLRDTMALEEHEVGLARQVLSDAVREYCRTLVVPDIVFRCLACGEDETSETRMKCILGDGQVLSVLQADLVSMLRPSVNVPLVNTSLDFSCAIRGIKPRRVVRNRLRADPSGAAALTQKEDSAWDNFDALR
eukprot:contig_12260_g2930